MAAMARLTSDVYHLQLAEACGEVLGDWGPIYGVTVIRNSVIHIQLGLYRGLQTTLSHKHALSNPIYIIYVCNFRKREKKLSRRDKSIRRALLVQALALRGLS